MHVYWLTLSLDTFFLNFWFCLTYNMTCIDRKFKLFVRIVSVYETNLKLKLSFGSTGALWDIVWFVVIGYQQRTAFTVISQNLGGIITSHLTYRLDYFITCNIASSHSLFLTNLINTFKIYANLNKFLWNYEQKWWLIICGFCWYF